MRGTSRAARYQPTSKAASSLEASAARSDEPSRASFAEPLPSESAVVFLEAPAVVW